MKPSDEILDEIRKRREALQMFQDIVDHKLEREMAEFIIVAPVKKRQIGFHPER